jgi:tRNA (cmo5U34)-methyltransferase
MKIKDETTPEGKWKFDGDVTKVFDDMLSRSIPQYDIMRHSCFEIGKRFVTIRSHIVDLGCSRGEAIAPFIKEFGNNNDYLGIEVSKPMLEESRVRFKKEITDKYVEIREFDLRNDYPKIAASVTLAILTIQFIPIEYRLQLIRDIYLNTKRGGCLIFVEKVLGNSADLNRTMVDIYHGMKKRNGYTTEQIERKRLSLEGVLVPVTAKWNEELLKMAGWNQVDCFWRWMNFAGWVAVKE